MWSRDFLAGVNKPVKISEKKKTKVMEQFSDPTRIKWHPESLYDFKVYYVYIPLKISMTVPMDRAKMEEVAQMLWMILTVAVFLDTREKIAVLVSHVLHVIE